MGSSGGAGKDTVADIIKNIAEHENQNVEKISLSKGIYAICNELKPDASPQRFELQGVGEQMRKIFGQDIWIKKTDREIDDLDSPVIIPDIRKLLEYSHYVVEGGFVPLFVKASPKVSRERLKARDGAYQEADLHRTIETQMSFVEALPTKNVGKTGLKKVIDSGCFNDIYIVNNSGSLEETTKQVEKWWECVQKY